MLSFRTYRIIQLTSALALAALTCGAAPNQAATRWTPAPNLSGARAGSCAALLADGSVMVTGGSNTDGALASVEVIGARRGSRPAGSMLTAREDHICAALPDGGLMVAGGRTSGGGVTNSAEIFDPSTRSWTAAGALSTARAGATATSLKDGRVLIAGGMTSGGASSATLEIFDPRTRRFTAAVSTMSSSRTGHAAAMLRDGRVVLAGGFDGTRVLDSIDIFDPRTGSVISGGRMATPRRGLSASAMLDGDVLFAGGNDGRQDLASAQLFHGSTASPGAEIAMSMARTNQRWEWHARGATASALQTPGHLVVIGGRNRNGYLSSSEEATYATLSSDKDDYHPGETVILTGTGWLPGETVQMNMTVDPKTHEDVTLTSVADANGNFTNSDYLVQKSDLDVRFYVTSTGLTSGRTAAVLTFTDALAGATLSIRDSNCGGAVTSISYGADACLWADVVTSGGGATFRLQWYRGTDLSADPARDVRRNISTGEADDTWDPNDTGTWTLVLCNRSAGGTCPANSRIPAAGITLTVGPRNLNVTGVTAASRVYNGTTAATLNLGSARLSGVINGDNVTLRTTGATGTFANKNAGTGKPVTVTGMTITGTEAYLFRGQRVYDMPQQSPGTTPDGTCATIAGTFYTFTGLTNCTTYYFQVMPLSSGSTVPGAATPIVSLAPKALGQVCN